MDADKDKRKKEMRFGQVYFAFGMRLAFAVAPEMCRLLALRKPSVMPARLPAWRAGGSLYSEIAGSIARQVISQRPPVFARARMSEPDSV